ncbi:MAG: FG-GAP-like repeat-containing protein [Gammaproteobacteria bacterium]|nr:FG-GAP-like repeat-containing protein [Gammaproteobacteria bacterium]
MDRGQASKDRFARRVAACVALGCLVASFTAQALPALSGAFLSAGLSEALNRLGAVVDETDPSSGSGGLGLGLISVDPQFALPATWSITLAGTSAGIDAPPVLLSNDSAPTPAIQIVTTTAGGEPTRLVLGWKAETTDAAPLIRLDIGSGDDTQALAVGDYAGAAADGTPGTPLLDVQYAVDACRAADRGFTIERLAFQGTALVELDLRFHCGDWLHGVVHYRDIGRLNADAVIVNGTVWEDQGMDGLREDGGTGPDLPLGGVTVELVKDDRTVSRTRTGDDGRFRFYTDLASYQVRVLAPRDMSFTARAGGADPALDSDVDPQTGTSELLVPPAPNNVFGGGGLAQVPPLTIGLGYAGGHPQLPLASTRFSRLMPGERVTYEVSEAGSTRFATDTVQPGSVVLNGSVARVVEDSDGNTISLSNDARGLRLHKARVTLSNGRSYDYRFAPPLVLLPGQVTLAPHASNGRVTVSRAGAAPVTLQYDFDARFSAGHGGLGASLSPMTTPLGPGLGLFSEFSLGFSGARGATPLAARVDAIDIWSLDVGLRDSQVNGSGASRHHTATAVRANVADSSDGNRTSDVLAVHAQSSAFGWWHMRGLAAPQWQPLGDGAEGLRVAYGDIDGDGRPDTLTHDTQSGLVSRVAADGLREPLAFAPPGSRLLGSVNSNRDGRARLLWRDDATAILTLWRLSDGHRVTQMPIASAPASTWTLQGSGDFDGNGSDDLVWLDADGGRYVLWLMDDGTRASVSVKRMPATWRLAAIDDFDGDGHADLFWHEPSTRATRLWLMDGTRVLADHVTRKATFRTEVVDSGDYDGDGAADLLWRHVANGNHEVWLMRGAQVRGAAAVGRLPDGFVPQR